MARAVHLTMVMSNDIYLALRVGSLALALALAAKEVSQ